MDTQTKEKIFSYINNQLAQAEGRFRSYTVDAQGKEYPKRSIFILLKKYLAVYARDHRAPRWIAIPGLRGVGKTTVLAQIYSELVCGPNRKLYISLDDAKNVLDVSLVDILSAYEEILGEVYENLEHPVYLFIDEVQYEEQWGITLKSLYDRTDNVFIFCTGSSAISLQTNPDVSRRVVMERLYPMRFTEYLLLKEGKRPSKGLGQEIRSALFGSANGKEVHAKLLELQPKVRRYWAGVERLEIDRYLKFGTLPFALQLIHNEPLIYKQIEQILSNVQYKDIPQVKTFEQATLNRLHQLLYLVASSDTVVVSTLASQLETNANTLGDMLEVLEKSEVLMRVNPHGSHTNQLKNRTRKPSKYLFLSSAYRSMFFNLIGSTITYDNYKGKLLEDVTGLSLYRIFSGRIGAFLTYDSASGGADFIVGIDGKKVVIEVGYGEKDYSQIHHTLERVNGDYGLSVSMSNLHLSEDGVGVSVPISYFLLI